MNSLRKKARLLRKSLGEELHNKYSQEICRKIQNFIVDKNVIMLYNAIDGEVEVNNLLQLRDKVFLFPRVEGENLIAVKSDDFVLGAYGINEPIGNEFLCKIDAVIVPMCAFDKKLNRLGFGKGYYDRFLKKRQCLKIGVAFSCQEVEKIIEKETDIRMDIIITEKTVLEA